MTRDRLLFVLLFSFLIAGASGAETPSEPVKPDAKETKPDPKTEQPSEKEVAAIKDAITRLTSDEFEVRQKACEELIAIGKKAVPLLTSTQKETEDAEVRERTKSILEKIAEASAMEGLTTLPSGLQYKVLKEGEGDPPGPLDTAVVHYTSKLTDGTEFDNSHKRGTPSKFPLNAVIRGWSEALQKMKPGSRWMLIIPPKLAYGHRGAPGIIPPDATLIYDIELISVEKK